MSYRGYTSQSFDSSKVRKTYASLYMGDLIKHYVDDCGFTIKTELIDKSELSESELIEVYKCSKMWPNQVELKNSDTDINANALRDKR